MADVSISEFKAAITEALKEEGMLRWMARECHVAESTVRRWALGTANPHPSVKWMILKALEAKRKPTSCEDGSSPA